MMKDADKFAALFGLAVLAIDPAQATPIVSTNVSVTPTGQPSQIISNSSLGRSTSDIDTLSGNYQNYLRGSATSIDNYTTQLILNAAGTGGEVVSVAKWNETFTNSSADTLSYNFTYAINRGFMGFGGLGIDLASASGTAMAGFDSNLTVNIGGITTDNIVAQRVMFNKAVGGASVISETSAGAPLTNLFNQGNGVNWATSYITVEIGPIASGNSFSLAYSLAAIVDTNFGAFCSAPISGISATCGASVFSFYEGFGDTDPRVGLSSRRVDTSVPEPASYGLMALGLAALGAARRRKRCV
jgi:PEP-CTERM motif